MYASSSASTPKKYLDAAVKLGNLLGEGVGRSLLNTTTTPPQRPNIIPPLAPHRHRHPTAAATAAIAATTSTTSTATATTDLLNLLNHLLRSRHSRQGHTCVNGGGKFGGMGALNVACKGAGATVVCVIHERWVLDLSEFKEADELIVVTGDDLAERKSKLLEVQPSPPAHHYHLCLLRRRSP